MEVNKFTAELCGIILGDGHMHKTANSITIAGGIDDLLYFQQRVIPLFRKCFPNVNPRIHRLKRKQAYHLIVENKAIFHFFLSHFGLKRGRKDDAHIPGIVVSNPTLTPHFVRGLFDTDGCFKFSKQHKTYAYYPRIRFAFMDSPLAHELQILLSKIGFIPRKSVRPNHGYVTDKNLAQYEISGQNALERWMRIVKPANPVQVTKYLFWKKYGYHVQYMTLSDRLSWINGQTIGPGGFEPPSMGVFSFRLPKPTILGR